MWITRDKDDNKTFNLTYFKPKRVKSGVWISDDEESGLNSLFYHIPIDIYPSVTWDDEPIEVEFTPKKMWYNCDEINNLLDDLGYMRNHSLSYIETVLENNGIKIVLFKSDKILKENTKIPNSWMYVATHNGDDFTEDLNEYINKNDAHKAAIIESLSYLWLLKKHYKKNETND